MGEGRHAGKTCRCNLQMSRSNPLDRWRISPPGARAGLGATSARSRGRRPARAGGAARRGRAEQQREVGHPRVARHPDVSLRCARVTDTAAAHDLSDPATDPFDVAEAAAAVIARAHRGRRATTSRSCSAPAGARPPTSSARRSRPIDNADVPGFAQGGRRRPHRQHALGRHRRHRPARPGLRHPHPLLRGPRRARGRARRPHRRPRPAARPSSSPTAAAACNPAWAPGTPVLISDHINLTAHLPHRGRELRRPHRPLLPAAARARPRGRPRPRRGRLRAVPRAALRDPGRGADGQASSAATWSACRRRSRRSPPARRAGGARHLAGHQPRRRHLATSRSATRRCSRPARPPPNAAAGCSPPSSAGSEAGRRTPPTHRSPTCSPPPGPGRDDDPDPVTRAELDGLARRRGRRATRGRRDRPRRPRSPGCSSSAPPGCAARLGAGPNRMNRAVVIRAAAGLTAYLQDERRPRAVRSSSATTRGTTPTSSRATPPRSSSAPGGRALGAAAPAADAGAGLRDPPPRRRRRGHGHGEPQPAAGQRLQGLPRRRQPDRAAGRRRRSPPHIAAVASVARRAAAPTTAGRRSATTVLDAYLDDVRTVVLPDSARATSPSCTPPCTASATTTVRRAFARGRASRRRSPVAAQAEPDPDFPTVAFPNPEEPGAIDAALDAAPSSPTPTSSSPTTPTPTGAPSRCPARGGLADAARRRGGRAARLARAVRCAGGVLATGRRVFANSIVSSRLLAAIAARPGVRHEETLTGFKWIARVPGLRYGYEEALGYCVDPDLVRDKDGVSRRPAARRAGRGAQGAGPHPRRPARRPRARARGVRHRRVLGARRRPGADRPVMERLRVDAAHRRSRASTSPGSTTSPGATAGCRRPRGCATTSPTARASSCGRPAPSPSSRSTSRSSSR